FALNGKAFHLDPCFFRLEAIDHPKEHFQELPLVPFDTFLLILIFDGLYKTGKKSESQTFDKKAVPIQALDLANIEGEVFPGARLAIPLDAFEHLCDIVRGPQGMDL